MKTTAPAVAPKLCRLEKLEAGTWITTGTFNLLHPERYPERLESKGKAGRATVLDSGKVYQTEVKTCPVCTEVHGAPYDGTCLL